MIVRIFRGAVETDRVGEFLGWVASDAAPKVRQPRGARYLLLGTRPEGHVVRIVIVTTWPDVETEIATLGDIGPRAPSLGLPPYLTVDRADHYELVDESGIIEPSVENDMLRVDRFVLTPGGEEAFFDRARSRPPSDPDALRMARLIGRRLIDDVNEVVAVTLIKGVPEVEAHDAGSAAEAIDWSAFGESIARSETEVFAAAAVELAPV